MEIEAHTKIDSMLSQWRDRLGADYIAYRNHCQRVFLFATAMVDNNSDVSERLAIAAAYHDLGVWVIDSLDYLDSSVQLAIAYLESIDRSAWAEEISVMIDQHHKMRSYQGEHADLADAFRKADWVDVLRGKVRFGLSRDLVDSVLADYPNAGFHQKLRQLGREQFRKNPFRPLPMLKF